MLTNIILLVLNLVCQTIAAPLDDFSISTDTVSQKSIEGTASSINADADPASALNASQGITGALCILVGLFLLFAGMRLFKVAISVAGFILFSELGYWVLVRTEPAGGFSDFVFFLVPIACGIIGSIIAWKLWRVGISILGALGGATLALLILSFKNGGVIQNSTGQIIFIIICAIIGAVLIHFFEVPVLIGSTSIAGAYIAMVGLDIFIKTGFANSMQLFLFGKSSLQAIAGSEGKVIGMIFGTLALAAVGAYVQYRANIGRQHRKY